MHNTLVKNVLSTEKVMKGYFHGQTHVSIETVHFDFTVALSPYDGERVVSSKIVTVLSTRVGDVLLYSSLAWPFTCCTT